MKARTWFCCEAIKKEEELPIAASKINIYIQQDEPLFVPPTSLLVEVASMTKPVLFNATLGFLAQDGEWKKEEKMSASLRGSSEENSYGYMVP